MKGNESIAKLLISSGAKVDARSHFSKKTALHWAIHDRGLPVIALLIKEKADIEAVDRRGMTPLLKAIDRGLVSVAEVLLDNKANPNARLSKGLAIGSTALHLAIRKRNISLVKMLIAKGADVNGVGAWGETPLMRAVVVEDEPIAEMLIAQRADVNSKAKTGLTALHIAILNQRKHVTKLLVESEAKVDIYSASALGMTDRVRSLIRADRKAAGKAGYYDLTPLHWATMGGHLDVMRLLIANGADPNAKAKDGVTPIYGAIAYDHHEATDMLISKGASVKMKATGGLTPLHHACSYGREKLVRVFLDKGAPVDERDTQRDTPLHYASRKGHEKVVAVLLRNRAEAKAKNKRGETPLDLARAGGYENVARLLIAAGAKGP